MKVTVVEKVVKEVEFDDEMFIAYCEENGFDPFKETETLEALAGFFYENGCEEGYNPEFKTECEVIDTFIDNDDIVINYVIEK